MLFASKDISKISEKVQHHGIHVYHVVIKINVNIAKADFVSFIGIFLGPVPPGTQKFCYWVGVSPAVLSRCIPCICAHLKGTICHFFGEPCL